MNKFISFKLFHAVLLAVTILVFSGSFTVHAAEKEPVRISYVEWPCAIVSTNIAKVVIEERLGRKVELFPVSAAVMFQSLASGETDATVTAWLPYTHANYIKRLKGKIEDLGILTGGAKLGFVVPDYVSYQSIEEINEHAKEFGGKIYGIDPGAGLMIGAEKAMKEYGLDNFELIEGSDAVMVAMLQDGIRKKEPVIVTGWAPHWMFGRWKLHFLDDPKQSFGKEESIHAMSRPGLAQDMPDVHTFLTNFSYENPEQLQTLMSLNSEKGANPLDNARKFVHDHKDLVNKWLKGL